MTFLELAPPQAWVWNIPDTPEWRQNSGPQHPDGWQHVASASLVGGAEFTLGWGMNLLGRRYKRDGLRKIGGGLMWWAACTTLGSFALSAVSSVFGRETPRIEVALSPTLPRGESPTSRDMSLPIAPSTQPEISIPTSTVEPMPIPTFDTTLLPSVTDLPKDAIYYGINLGKEPSHGGKLAIEMIDGGGVYVDLFAKNYLHSDAEIKKSQVFLQLPYTFDGHIRLIGECSDPCRVSVLDDKNTELDPYESTATRIDNDWPNGLAGGTWLKITPAKGEQVLPHVRFLIGPHDQPVLTLPDVHRRTEPNINGLTLSRVPQEHEMQALFAIARPVGLAHVHYQALDMMGGEGIRFTIPFVGAPFHIPDAFVPTNYAIIPVSLSGGEHLVELACNGECSMRFFQVTRGSNRQIARIDENMGPFIKDRTADTLVTSMNVVGGPAQGWIIIEQKALGNAGSGVDLTIWEPGKGP